MNKIITLAVEAELALQLAEISHLIDQPLGGSQATQLALCLGAGILIGNLWSHLEPGKVWARLRQSIGRKAYRDAAWIATAAYCGPGRRQAPSVSRQGGRRAGDIALVGRDG